MKKKILLLAVAAICTAILGSGTLAYFTADKNAHNVITSGSVDVQIEEWQETEQGLIPYPEDEPVQIMPGTELSKIVTVKNLEEPCYIRAGFEMFITDSKGNTMELTEEQLDRILHVALNEDDWVQKREDGNWWYYKKSVKTGEVTEPLFTEVVFDGPNMTNEYQNCTIEINVSAQAVQAANNGESAMTAAGWPKE